MLSQKQRAQLGLTMATLIWGATFTIVQEALQDSPPFAFTGYRFLSATILLLLILRRDLFQLSKSEYIGGTLCGLCLFGGFALQNFGLLYTKATNSAFITSTNVLLVPILLFLVGQPISKRVWLAVSLAVLGLFLLLDPNSDLNLGDILTALCALSFALHIIVQDKSIQQPVDHIRFFFVQALIVTICSGICSTVFEGQATIWSQRLIVALLITGIFATTISFLLMIWAQRILPPTQTALFFSLEPVAAAIFAILIVGEHISLMEWVGGAIIVTSVFLAENNQTQEP